MDISGAHAVVTGGSSGIGLAVARLLGERGARVSLVARDPDRLDRARERLAASGIAVEVASADVADADALEAAIAQASDVHGPVDVLVASAGILLRPAPFVDLDLEEIERHLAVNYLGTVHAVRAVLPGMLARRRGSITMIASAAAFIGTYGYGSYTPTKFALSGLGEVLRSELVDTGVHVGVVYPPDVDTPMLQDELPKRPPETEAIVGTIPPLEVGRVARTIVEGIERERFRIVPDVRTKLLAASAGPLHRVYAAFMDRAVRRTRR